MTANEDDVDTNRGSEKGATNPLEGADVSKKRQRFQLKEPPGASKKRGKPQRSQHLQLNHSTIHWDNYDTDFPRHGRQGEDEIYNFLQRLEKNSNFPAIRANATGQLLEDVRTKNKIEILRRLQAAIPILPPDDIILLQDGTSLRTTLDLPFEIPLLYRNFSHRLGGHLYSIQDFLAHLQDDQAASISVYDYSIEDPEKRTRNMTVGEVCLAFEESVRGPALNFLDIENRTTIPFCPHGITSRNIKTRIDSRTGGNKGKTGSRWNAERQKEFFLLAQKNAISPTHIDTDGKMTWVLILQGWKVWYFPRRVTTHILRWLAQVGSQVSAYFEGGWIKVVLRAGDLFVMPPMFPHSVFTSGDCLAVGGHFYTAAHLGRSIEGLKLQEDHPELFNEDTSANVYDTLAEIFRECDDVTTPEQKAHIRSSSSLFRDPLAITSAGKLSRGNVLDILRSRGTIFDRDYPRKRLDELLKQGETPARARFREELKSFCDRFDSQRLSEPS